MFFGIWKWLRTRARTAVLAGVADAVAELSDPEGDEAEDDATIAADWLLERLQPPAPDDGEDDANALDLADEGKRAGIDVNRLETAAANGNGTAKRGRAKKSG